MVAMTFTVKELMVGGWRRASAGGALSWGVGVLLLMGGFPVAAQESDAAAETNDISAAEVLARISEMVQAAQSEDMPLPNGGSATNDLSQAGPPAQSANRFDRGSRSESSNRFQGPSRSSIEDRRSRSRRSFRSRSDQGSGSRSSGDNGRGGDRALAGAPEGTNAGPARLDYAAFRIIVDRNIFDPNRTPHRVGERTVRQPPKVLDSLTLVGTMSYENGTFAFFDGSSSDYKKALKLSDVIAGYRVTNIAPNGVTLTAGTNALNLGVGMQLRREEDGSWLLSGQAGSYAATPAATSTNAAAATATTGSDTASGAAESDIIKKLMQRRAQE